MGYMIFKISHPIITSEIWGHLKRSLVWNVEPLLPRTIVPQTYQHLLLVTILEHLVFCILALVLIYFVPKHHVLVFHFSILFNMVARTSPFALSVIV